MKKIKTDFEIIPALKYIEVLFRASERDSQVEELMERVMSRETEKLIFFDENNSARIIAADDIISVSVDGKLVDIVTEGERFLSKQTLQSIEKELNDERFIRISRHEIINLKKVIKYNFSVGGTLCIEMANGIETWASRRCIPLIRQKLSSKKKKG